MGLTEGMSSSGIERAREQWLRGNARAATGSAWDAVNAAMMRGDRATVEEVGNLAQSIADESEGKTQKQAEQLAAYCRLSLEGVGTGVQATSALARMFGRRKTKKCPDCAEKISPEAKVCPHCRYRFPVDQP